MKEHSQHMMPNSYTSRHFVENGHHQNAEDVDFQHVHNQANSMPVRSASAKVHWEDDTQPGSLKGKMNWEQNGGCREHVLPAGVVGPQSTSYDRDNICVNFAEKRHSVQVQRDSIPPVTSNDRDQYIEPVTAPEYIVTRKDSSRYQEQLQLGEDCPPRNEDHGVNSVHMSADDVRDGAVTSEDMVISGVTDGLTEIQQSETVNKAQSSVDTAMESVAAYDCIDEGKISETRRRESTDKSQYPIQPFIASSISTGNDEVIMDTQGTSEWGSVDIVIELSLIHI